MGGTRPFHRERIWFSLCLNVDYELMLKCSLEAFEVWWCGVLLAECSFNLKSFSLPKPLKGAAFFWRMSRTSMLLIWFTCRDGLDRGPTCIMSSDSVWRLSNEPLCPDTMIKVAWVDLLWALIVSWNFPKVFSDWAAWCRYMLILQTDSCGGDNIWASVDLSMTLVDTPESIRRSISQSLISTLVVGSDLPILKRYTLANSFSSFLFCAVTDSSYEGVPLGVAGVFLWQDILSLSVYTYWLARLQTVLLMKQWYNLENIFVDVVGVGSWKAWVDFAGLDLHILLKCLSFLHRSQIAFWLRSYSAGWCPSSPEQPQRILERGE